MVIQSRMVRENRTLLSTKMRVGPAWDTLATLAGHRDSASGRKVSRRAGRATGRKRCAGGPDGPG